MSGESRKNFSRIDLRVQARYRLGRVLSYTYLARSFRRGFLLRHLYMDGSSTRLLTRHRHAWIEE